MSEGSGNSRRDTEGACKRKRVVIYQLIAPLMPLLPVEDCCLRAYDCELYSIVQAQSLRQPHHKKLGETRLPVRLTLLRTLHMLPIMCVLKDPSSKTCNHRHPEAG